MTGGGGGDGGRFLRLRIPMSGGGGATGTNKIESKNNCPISEITETPSGSIKTTELPLTSIFEFDFYAQARKALSFRSPYDSEGSPATPVSFSGANTLPGELSQSLSRHSDGRKQHKKSHSGSKKKSSTLGRLHRGDIWDETKEYFRELNTEDIDRLDPVSVVGFSSIDKCFFIPSLGGDTLCGLYAACNRMLANACEQDSLNSANEVELISDGMAEVEEMVVRGDNEPLPIYVDGDDGEVNKLEVKEESQRDKTDEKDLTTFSGVEWLLGSKRKIYLASERPSKKRKLLGKDAGLEKLFVVRPVQGLDSICHYCSFGDMGDPLNCLIKCGSCGMMVHQRCYGVHEDVDSSWLCSWCKRKNDVGSSTERPCLLCPKQDGALKPVRKRRLGSENERSKVEFAHLFCCQWMPEVYLENTMTMEPILNLDELKDTRKKLICYLCKVKYGACVRCSNRVCRTSFHPICAREARHRMEIWGRLGCDEVELHAFCSKHSEVQDDFDIQSAGDIPLTADVDLIKLNNIVSDGENILDSRPNSEFHTKSGDSVQPADKEAEDENDNKEVNAHSAFNFTMILKKLIDLGKVDAKDVASDIGVSANSLITMLTDNHVVPEIECKLVKWLKNHAHIGSTQRNFKVKIGSQVLAEGPGAVSLEESDICDTVSVKSVPPRRRTKSRRRIVKDDNPSFGHKINGGTEGNVDISLINLCLPENGLVGDTKQCQQMTTSSIVPTNGEVVASSYIHPFIYSKLMQTKSHMLEKPACHSAGFGDRVVSHSEASSSTGLCCNNHNLHATSGEWISICREVAHDQLVKARNPSMLELSPSDEVEGELIYYQQRLVCNAVARKRISDGLVSKVVKRLDREIDAAGKQKWDAVFVSQYHHGLREAKKQGRKECRHKEAQALLAAAAASRISSIQKDILEKSANHADLLKLNISGVRPGVHSKPKTQVKAISKPSLAKNSDFFQLAPDFSKECPRTCDICRRIETILNPVFVCSSCKVAVHLDCYCSVKSSTGPWRCELCEDLSSSQGSGDLSANFWKKPCFVAQCGLCGCSAGAFRKSVDGQWVHALCAEWVLESTYKRGQVNPIDGMEIVCKEIDTCTVCYQKQGVCLKCSYGHCRSTFHPTCARSAGFYMAVTNNDGKLQHKAYCEKHSSEQRAKADTQMIGVERLKSLKQVRVELERLRLLCERIIKREKLKRELGLCSHDILASRKNSILSALARHPFYQPEVSSESATTSLKGYTDSYISGSETGQRSDDITVDSTGAGKRCARISMSTDNDQKTGDSSTSQNLQVPKLMQRVSLSGKQIPQRLSLKSRNLSDDVETQSKHSKTKHR